MDIVRLFQTQRAYKQEFSNNDIITPYKSFFFMIYLSFPLHSSTLLGFFFRQLLILVLFFPSYTLTSVTDHFISDLYDFTGKNT